MGRAGHLARPSCCRNTVRCYAFVAVITVLAWRPQNVPLTVAVGLPPDADTVTVKSKPQVPERPSLAETVTLPVTVYEMLNEVCEVKVSLPLYSIEPPSVKCVVLHVVKASVKSNEAPVAPLAVSEPEMPTVPPLGQLAEALMVTSLSSSGRDMRDRAGPPCREALALNPALMASPTSVHISSASVLLMVTVLAPPPVESPQPATARPMATVAPAKTLDIRMNCLPNEWGKVCNVSSNIRLSACAVKRPVTLRPGAPGRCEVAH